MRLGKSEREREKRDVAHFITIWNKMMKYTKANVNPEVIYRLSVYAAI